MSNGPRGAAIDASSPRWRKARLDGGELGLKLSGAKASGAIARRCSRPARAILAKRPARSTAARRGDSGNSMGAAQPHDDRHRPPPFDHCAALTRLLCLDQGAGSPQRGTHGELLAKGGFIRIYGCARQRSENWSMSSPKLESSTLVGIGRDGIGSRDRPAPTSHDVFGFRIFAASNRRRRRTVAAAFAEVMPTGAGKSLCYNAALARRGPASSSRR